MAVNVFYTDKMEKKNYNTNSVYTVPSHVMLLQVIMEAVVFTTKIERMRA
jgi:hypothetical protein